ncbi:MAG: alpha/beta hydrolase [Acetobacteraceae bacterium]|nr:alpha/beta hydrolase [Acetobacteraceae bacterium]
MNGVKWALCALLLAASGQPAAAQMSNLPDEVRLAISEMGTTLNTPIVRRTFALMQPLQASRAGLSVTKDLAYGADPLQKMDLYATAGIAAASAPIVVFIHGGGFTNGDKHGVDNVAAFFARHGLLGVNMNYRLAPAVSWPAQSLDIGSAVDWLQTNAARYGGDPHRIFLIGHSSGAAIAASYVLDQSISTVRDGVVGAVLISGPYGFEPLQGPAHEYYGDDRETAAGRQPRTHVYESKLPMLIVAAEFDPPDLGAESHELATAICVRDGKCPPFVWLNGHNHISEVASIDTRDHRLGREILDFVRAVGR